VKRTLVIIRHAKAEEGDWNTADFDRALSKRGISDAQDMAARLKVAGIKPDVIVASAALRTTTTAQQIAAILHFPQQQIVTKPNLYLCNTDTLGEVLWEETTIPNSATTVFIVAHNPTVTQFVYDNLPKERIMHMPTCAMVAINFEAEKWSDFSTVERSLLFFDYPKNR
jgi:phosphohistidine phosphatase